MHKVKSNNNEMWAGLEMGQVNGGLTILILAVCWVSGIAGGVCQSVMLIRLLSHTHPDSPLIG